MDKNQDHSKYSAQIRQESGGKKEGRNLYFFRGMEKILTNEPLLGEITENIEEKVSIIE
ncbi:MAG: hypothetical protein LBL20_03050 [Treponema sp.]|jgi:hypothetical protein|nr:hypothetical protein [Treponema sp.]